ncbi:DUF3325 domain-containing protein [Shewanella insulae]|uniref:DUF3325 domain-containing protein n=1 Tax=Shewanella insulae TaxID=2681496 RepID=UPI001EFC9AB7|nr:DUF3325 domain-containing protein [Shewanella insulae]MCG9714868.1 DUF3325 domain-containing protein [Shewanella insulae]MCG9753615.1 DUF3325 domain-containing protein [Shewanella insulae]
MILALSLSFIAFGALALAMFGHFKSCFKRPPSQVQQRGLTLVGWGLLALSFVVLLGQYETAYATILLFGVMSAAALTVILLLSYQAKRLPASMAIAALLALVDFSLFV